MIVTNEPAACLQSLGGEAMSLVRVDARGRVDGTLFELAFEQRWRNATADDLECVYSFPLPHDAVLLGVVLEIGGRRHEGVVSARADAARTYEAAVADGDTGLLLECADNGLYTLNLGNLRSGDHALVAVRFAQVLRIEDGRVRIAVPTTIAPRYGSPDGLAPHAHPATSLVAEYPLSLSIEVGGAAGAVAPSSPTHRIRVTSIDGKLRVLLDDGSLDRDFVLLASAAVDAAAVVAKDGDGVVAMASFKPKLPTLRRAAIDLRLLVDCSGSMSGDSIDSARLALRGLLAVLGEGDRVTLSRFGNEVRHELADWLPARGADAPRIARCVDTIAADLGGTEMQAALLSTFDLARRAGSAGGADVLLITDGEVWDVDGVVAAAKASGHRIFAIGVGSAPAESLLRRLAESTGGACEFATPGEDIAGAAARLLERARVPRASDIRVSWPFEPTWTVGVPAAIFDGDTVTVFAGFREPPRGIARLSATVGARRIDLPVDLDADIVCAAPAASDALPRLAANARILAALAHIEGAAQQGHTQEAREARQAREAELRRLAVDYQLVTRFTSLVAVHLRADEDKADGMPRLQRIAQMRAAGSHGVGSAMPAPQVCLSALEDFPVRFSRRGPAVLMDIAAEQSFDYGSPRSAGPARRKKSQSSSFSAERAPTRPAAVDAATPALLAKSLNAIAVGDPEAFERLFDDAGAWQLPDALWEMLRSVCEPTGVGQQRDWLLALLAALAALDPDFAADARHAMRAVARLETPESRSLVPQLCRALQGMAWSPTSGAAFPV